MGGRFGQLMIIGGIYQLISLCFDFFIKFDYFKDIPYFHTPVFLWTQYLVFLLFLFLSVVLFIFPMKKFNKEFIKHFPKSYGFLTCIGWLPYFALPLTILTNYYKDGAPDEWFDKLVLYSQTYHYLLPGAFILAFIVVIKKSGDESQEKEAKAYKNRYY